MDCPHYFLDFGLLHLCGGLKHEFCPWANCSVHFGLRLFGFPFCFFSRKYHGYVHSVQVINPPRVRTHIHRVSLSLSLSSSSTSSSPLYFFWLYKAVFHCLKNEIHVSYNIVIEIYIYPNNKLSHFSCPKIHFRPAECIHFAFYPNRHKNFLLPPKINFETKVISDVDYPNTKLFYFIEYQN